jgi:hypothetical protein
MPMSVPDSCNQKSNYQKEENPTGFQHIISSYDLEHELRYNHMASYRDETYKVIRNKLERIKSET